MNQILIIQSMRARWVKSLAAFILFNLIVEILWPIKAFALTGGPSQPEVESFEPVGTTDMVDLFTGDFNYNIPLFDVGGYPINLAYHGGVGMDQEASWVGLGWNINPGVINRTMRGMPDDFNGDEVVREVNMKPNRTMGVNVNSDLEIFGFGWDKAKDGNVDLKGYNRKQHNRGKFNFGLGVMHNNYRGLGYSLDLSYDISKTSALPENLEKRPDGKPTGKSTGNKAKDNRHEFTDLPLKGNVGLSANSQEGANWNASASFSWGKSSNKAKSLGMGIGYNSFGGINDFSVSSSFRIAKEYVRANVGLNSSIPIGTSTYVPSQSLSFKTQSINFNGTVGFEAFGGHPDIRVKGFWNKEELAQKEIKSRAYGYLYEQNSEHLKGQEGILLDFNREKDGAYNKYRTHLPLVNSTYDLYSVQGQGVGGMYRPHRTSLGVYYDPTVKSGTGASQFKQGEIGLELGFGVDFHFGSSALSKGQFSETGLWKKGNDGWYDFLNKYNRPATEGGLAGYVYFKAGGELTPGDDEYNQSWDNESAVKLSIEKLPVSKRGGRKFAKISTTSRASSKSNQKRQVRANTINFLTASDAKNSGIGLDPNIISYRDGYWEAASIDRSSRMEKISRIGNQGRREDHISEITSTSADGTRYVYGIPVYNTTQMDVSFSISPDNVDGDNSPRTTLPDLGLVRYEAGDNDKDLNQRGPDHYFEKTKLPAYAHSYLLTGVLSADYVDVTGDGITDDDLGSAVKFNYRRTSSNYKWRNPYGSNMAMLDQGFLSDPTDDKASYSYGEKEMWYVHSIVSRTHIAEFRISPRNDGAGVVDENGGYSSATNNKSFKLDSIILYSKWDRLKNGDKALPVKIIVFQYDYSLCQGVLNNNSSGGKLTLKAVYFTYGQSNKGALSPYRFTYADNNPNYDQRKYDRWGNFKEPSPELPNRFFPYVDQSMDSTTHATNASAWNLKRIDLPSGGKIDVEYEADDYAWVQDKRAMQMVKILGSSQHIPEAKTVPSEYLYDNGKENQYFIFKSLVPYSGEMNNESAKRKFVIDNYLRDESGNQTGLLAYQYAVNMNPQSKSANWEYISGFLEPARIKEKEDVYLEFKNLPYTEYQAKLKLYEKWVKTDVNCGLYKKSGETYCYIKAGLVSQGDVGLTDANPISKRAWQIGLQNLRKVLYPGSDQQTESTNKSETALRGLLSSLPTALNIFTGPYQNLRWKNIASKFKKNESFIRFYNPKYKKYGGGARVKKLIIDDQWNEMGGSQETSSYGQSFDYTVQERINGELKTISSGVAQYEPGLGSDENPFHMPSFYTDKRPGAPDLNDYYTEPFGESFFPPPTVGYSKVTVKNIPKQGAKATATGKTIHLFYTARDFPVKVEYTRLNESKDDKASLKRKGKFLKNLLSPVKRDAAAATQGYSIKLNDMHGKPRGVKIHSELGKTAQNPDGDLISGTEYKYKTEATTPNINAPFPNVSDSFKAVPKGASLNNSVWTMDNTGKLALREIGKEMDVSIDLRSSYNKYEHYGLEFNNDQFFLVSIPMPWPKYLVDQKLFQSACVTKVIQQYGILEETVAYDHSSVVRTRNLVWDLESGNVLLTATTNEFDDPIYNYNYPAYYAFDGMGPAYKNIDRVAIVQLGTNGWSASLDSTYFVPGDELLLKSTSAVKKGWVLKRTGNTIQVIDKNGLGITGTYEARVIRSGRRNLLSASAGQVVSMNKNIKSGDSLVLDKNIISATATTFSDNWPGYLNKAYKLQLICDTTIQELVDIYKVFSHVVNNEVQETYLYNENDKNGFDLEDLSWFTSSAIRERLDSFCKDESLNSQCSLFGGFDSVGYFFGFDSTDFEYDPFSDRYYLGQQLFKRFKCDNDTQWRYCSVSCPYGVQFDSVNCHFSLADIDSVSSNYTIQYSGSAPSLYGILKTKVYYNGTYCWVTIISDCTISKISCYSSVKCDYVLGEYLNPYTNGMRGNWRQKEAFAFQGSRKYLYTKDTTDIRHDGLIENYGPYWKFKYNGKGLVKNTGSNSERWISTGQTTIITPEGNGVESRDALGIYGSQLFGYNQTLVTAVASNARYQQIAFDNFEDYTYPYYQCNRDDHWNFKEGLDYVSDKIQVPNATLSIDRAPDKTGPIIDNYAIDGSGNVGLDRSDAHTGLYSMRVNAGQTHSVIRQIDFSGVTIDTSYSALFKFTDVDRAIKPFAPTAGKYIFSGWVHEELSNPNGVNTFSEASVKIQVYYNNGITPVEKEIFASGVIINGWQRMEGFFDVPSNADSIKIILSNTGEVKANFDDLRVHTYNGNMKSFVYDPVLLKVMAELDENNFATFYEYDPEGNLVRVKKETERGIVTVQEARKSIRRTLP